MESVADSTVNDITPEETEDEGARNKEVENSDLDLTNSEGEAEHLQAEKKFSQLNSLSNGISTLPYIVRHSGSINQRFQSSSKPTRFDP